MIGTIRMAGICLLVSFAFVPLHACSGNSSEAGDASTEKVPETLPGSEDMSGPAFDIAERLGLGWNLGNQLDSHSDGVSSETAWGNPKVTQRTFDKVRAAGFSSVRIPVTWLGHFGPAPDYVLDKEWLDRVAEVVDYAEKAGLNAIINIHHDGAESRFWLDIGKAAADPYEDERIRQQISAIWTQIAERFRDKGDFLIFEAFNEIHDGGWGWGGNRTDGGKQYRCLDGWNQTFVDAVRSSGGKNAGRYLAVPGYCTNPEITVEHFRLPEDTVEDRILVSVHYYEPTEYTLTAKYSEWGKNADPGKCAGENEEERVIEVFSALYEAFVSKGIPVYLGEIGCVNRAAVREQEFQRYWFEYVITAARTCGMAPFVWDNGAEGTGNEKHAYIDHGTGEYSSEPARKAVETMVKAIMSDK